VHPRKARHGSDEILASLGPVDECQRLCRGRVDHRADWRRARDVSGRCATDACAGATRACGATVAVPRATTPRGGQKTADATQPLRDGNREMAKRWFVNGHLSSSHQNPKKSEFSCFPEIPKQKAEKLSKSGKKAGKSGKTEKLRRNRKMALKSENLGENNSDSRIRSSANRPRVRPLGKAETSGCRALHHSSGRAVLERPSGRTDGSGFTLDRGPCLKS